ncbi:hypothetical protein [Pseudodesulfovibrio indicus]|uniref:Uncharacterized protein n=1 Tax=Pseudodesulfovibrio indicus TaxID=1716143 RepID=A0ABM5YUM2_9BACT|nr:hypothetical protein [Pseudodesulfovibrio indicus]AMK10876.1 hypothetical protein AWY79_07020 [Pseudodesulfovibrio indicus]
MDHFGIGPAIQGAARIYSYSARRTGRTQSLLESVKDGDRVVFLNHRHAEQFKSLCRERGINVDCISSPAEEPDHVLHRGRSKGRTIFDHCWVEAYYYHHIERGMRLLDQISERASGHLHVAAETDAARYEREKWSQNL